MAEARVFIFAPADKDGATHRILEEAGCEVVLGNASWETPLGSNEQRGDVPDNVFNTAVIPRWQQRFGGRSVFEYETAATSGSR